MVPGANLHHPQALVFSVNTPGARASMLCFFSLMFIIKRPCVFGEIWARPTSNSLFCFSNKTWQPHKSYICRAKAKETNNMHRLQSFQQERRLCQTDHAQEVHTADRKWKVSCQERVQVTFHAILKLISGPFLGCSKSMELNHAAF